MGKKRKFSRFIRWIKSDLPEENKSVLLLGVTKLPSPRFDKKSRPHTLHLDHNLSAKSQTIDILPYPRTKLSLLTKSKSNDSLISDDEEFIDVAIENRHFQEINGKIDYKKQNGNDILEKTNNSFLKNIGLKRVSFQSDKNLSKVGFCTELPFEYYHPSSNGKVTENTETDDVISQPKEIMDKSVDSIGSCSLDVDASSTDFSDSSFGSSNYTLRSLLATSSPTKEKNPKFNSIDIIENKKPSYLNLACQVNGYSDITNYDSKLRENFRIPRSREVSPIRPQDYHVIVNNSENLQSKENHIKYLSPNNLNYQKSPSKMSESKSHTVLQSSYNYSSSTSTKMSYTSSKESRHFAKSMLYEDKIDGCLERSRMNGKFSSFESSKTYSNGTQKEGIFTESVTTKEAYFSNGQAQNGSNKSFIQQRVERLYGPAALAQGFFILNKKKSRAEIENDERSFNNSLNSSNDYFFDSESELSMKQSCSSPSLPVLRHLRPEFRAQLPILSPKRVNSLENTMPKSTTVPISLTTVTNGTITNGSEKLTNGTKSVNSIENKENIQKELTLAEKVLDKKPEHIKLIPENIPAAPKVVLPIKSIEVLSSNGSDVNGNKSDPFLNGEAVCVKNPEVIKDGHYFLDILKRETDRLIKLAEIVEVDMENKTELSDEVLGYLRSASGKARLLVSQKMQQFEGLCHKNINQIPGEPFPTTTEDLQGFWDMVMLQVTQVDQLFADIDSYRKNNWIIPEKPKPDTTDGTKPKKVIIVKKAVNEKAEAQRKQREAARKKMIEERRRAMKEKQQQDQSIEIYIPESSS